MEDKQVAAFKEKHLLDGEEIIDFLAVQRDKDIMVGLCVVTNKRVAYYRKGALSDNVEPWPIDKISSVESKRGILGYKIKLFTSGDDLELIAMDKNGGERIAKRIQQLLHAGVDQSVKPASVKKDDPLAALEKLGKLRAAGVVTEAEFQNKKADLLSRI